jgi:hypothetical protein
MEVGQVSFHKSKTVKRIKINARENAVINRMMKTRQELCMI